MNKIKVGFIGLMHKNFPGDKENSFKKISEGFKKLANDYNFIPYVVEKGIFTEIDARKACGELSEQKIEYLGLWALPEDASRGPLPANSFCGMSMNASILKEYLGIKKYKWFYGNIDNKMFIERFKITVKALQAIKNIQGSRMAIIGGIADGFDDQYYDERKLYQQFKVRVIRTLEFDDVCDKMKCYSSHDINDIKDKIISDVCEMSELVTKKVDNTARLIKAITDFKDEMDLSAITLNCWPKFRRKLNMVACTAIGFLNHFGIVTACEGDVYGMLSMYLLRQLSSYPALLMDLVDFSEDDQSLLFWHCGIGSKNLAYKGEITLTAHSNPAYISGHGIMKHSPVANMIYKKGKATALRITNNGNNIFVLDGEFNNPEKPSFNGSRGWLSNLRFNHNPINVNDLINTILVNGIQHHYAIALGNYSKEMLEIGNWLGLEPVKKLNYTDYLQL